MLETMNDYISFTTLVLIVLIFIYIILSLVFKSIERFRIAKALQRQEQEERGEI